jgi:hypothetical protein
MPKPEITKCPPDPRIARYYSAPPKPRGGGSRPIGTLSPKQRPGRKGKGGMRRT